LEEAEAEADPAASEPAASTAQTTPTPILALRRAIADRRRAPAFRAFA
jgi:hypothetical protein